jgi:hypothetical protein
VKLASQQGRRRRTIVTVTSVGATKVRYRDAWGNAKLAALWGGLALTWALILATSDGSQGPVMRWRGGIAAGVVFGLLVLRCLLRGVVVDGDGVTRRTVLTTTYVPWADVVGTEFDTPIDATFTLTDGSRVRVETVVDDDQPPLRSAYEAVREQWSLLDGWGEAYPTPRSWWFTLGFIVSGVAVVVGGVVWDDARFDAAHYAQRARREQTGVARVIRVELEEHHHEDGDPTFTTHVAARVRVPGARSVVVDLDRSGDVAARYRHRDEIAVVYNRTNPLDADFADRPHRRSDDSSVDTRSTTGSVLFGLGLVGILGCGSVIAVLRYRRTPTATKRRSARMPR